MNKTIKTLLILGLIGTFAYVAFKKPSAPAMPEPAKTA